MQKQWIISLSDCDVWWKVDFIPQQLSGWTKKNFQITSQSQTWDKKRSWSLFGRLLLAWSTTAFWIPVKPLHLEVCSANQWDAPKTAVPTAGIGPWCCCCCQVASLVSDSVRPHRWQPTRLPRPWDSPGKNTGVGCRFLLQCMKVKSEREVAQSCPTLSDPMDYSLPGSIDRAQFFSTMMPDCTSHNQYFRSWTNGVTKFCLICHIHLTSCQPTTTSSSISTTSYRENASKTSRRAKITFQEFVESWSTDFFFPQ